MGLPNVTDNYKGYEEGDLSKYVEQLKEKQFLLVSIFLKHSSLSLDGFKYYIIQTILSH